MTPDTIRRLRAALGETQPEFARRLSVSVRAVARWEAGEDIPQRTSLHGKRLERLIRRHNIQQEV